MQTKEEEEGEGLIKLRYTKFSNTSSAACRINPPSPPPPGVIASRVIVSSSEDGAFSESLFFRSLLRGIWSMREGQFVLRSNARRSLGIEMFFFVGKTPISEILTAAIKC